MGLMEDIETTNDFLVGSNGHTVQFLFPPTGPLDKEKVLRLAAWLVALADPLQERFPKILEAVLNT